MYASLLSLLTIAPMVTQVMGRSCGMPPSSARAIYMLSNNEVNSILALPVQKDGMLGPLSDGSTTSTGGKGLSGINGMTNQPAGPDSLFSQAALAVVGNKIFAVNPGSNTLSMFSIDKHDPTKITLLQEPALLPGEFPVTVAASKKNKVVCVGFSGAKAGISCSSYSDNGIEKMDTLRPINLGQTTPPVGPTNTISQVFFAGDERTLYSTVKGNPATNNTGFLAAYPIDGGSVGQQGVKSSPSGTTILFGSDTIPGSNNLFVTDPSFGAAVLKVDGDGKANNVERGTIQGQQATCWATVSPITNSAFVTDVALSRLVEMSLVDASVLNIIDLSANGDPGLTDLASAGQFVYALSPGNGSTEASVTVVDAINKKQVQHVQLKTLGAGKSASGMAVLH